MVKYNQSVLLAFLFTMLIVFNGCYKDIENFEPYEVPEVEITGDIEDFYSMIPDYGITKTIRADERALFVTENGTVVEIAANSFEIPGEDIAAADIDLRFIELLKPSLFALEGLPTLSDKQLLKTEGVFRVEATKDGKELNLKEGKGIKIRLPDDTPSEDALLFEATGEGEDFNWNALNDQATTPFGEVNIAEWAFEQNAGIDTFVAGYGYEFNCPLWKWINVDIFVEIPESDRTSVCIDLSEIYTDQNTVAFMLFKDIESILTLQPNSDKMQFCEPYGATPIGFKVYFIVISNQGEDVFHFALQDATIEKDHVEIISPEEKSLDDIIKIIEDL